MAGRADQRPRLRRTTTRQVSSGLLDLYETTFEERRLEEAARLEPRPRGLLGNAVPSGNSVAVEHLQRLAFLASEASYPGRSLGAPRRPEPAPLGSIAGGTSL